MKKWKEMTGNEKWMLAFIILLLIGIIIRWSAVQEGVSKGFNWFRSDDTEEVFPADSVPIELRDAVPDEPLDMLPVEIQE